MRLGFDSVAAFEAGYGRFVTPQGIFLASRKPRPTGTLLRFELQTRSGESLLLAEGRVVAVRAPDAASSQRVPGMHVRFTRLTPESRERVERMSGARLAATEPDRTPETDPDGVASPAPARIVADLPNAPIPTNAEAPVPLAEADNSALKGILSRLFAIEGGEPPADPFAQRVDASLPTVDGTPLDPLPDLPVDAILP